jgi:hypothetical protein
MSMSGFRILRVIALLFVVSATRADQRLVGDLLTLDATVWTNGHVWRAERADLARNEFGVERVAAPLGLIGRLGQVASVRLSADLGKVYPLDLYSDFRWASGLNVRVGQFVLPLGLELMTDPRNELIVNSSLLAGYAAPAGNRDIGLMGGMQNARFSLYGAVVNGAGANLADNNPRKDVCGRLALTPFANVDGVLALRAYYGWPGAADTAWRTLAAEARVARGPLELQAEFQNHSDNRGQNNSTYVQAGWHIGQLEPVARIDLVLSRGSLSEWMMAGGLNLEPVSDHVKVMVDFTYHRNFQANWSVFGFLFRLQAGL